MIWVYALCERPDLPPPRRRGLAQAPLEGIPVGRLLAVVTRHEHSPGEPALDALWAHERVVERLMADRAVLPLRFGTRMADEAELARTVGPREEALLDALDRVRGRVELGVRAMRPSGGGEPPAPPARNGREYMLGKLAGARRAEAAADSLHDPLAALAAAALRRPTQAPDEILRAAYLVDRGSVARFRGAVERLGHEQDGVALLCTGPWPPYSFAS